jgi:hypothetical protein
MICIPKYSEIHGDVPLPAIGIQGDYRIEKYDLNGRLLQDTGWVKNLITNFGMESMTDDGAFVQFFFIGDSAVAPQVTDTQMGNWVQTGAPTSNTSSKNDVPELPDYEKWNQQVQRFGSGTALTVREVGMGSNNVGGELFSRQLVTPEITKSVDQILDVTWRITKFPNLIQQDTQATFEGVLYDIALLPMGVALHQDNTGTFGAVLANNATSGQQVSDEGLVLITDNALTGNLLTNANGGTSGASGYVGGGPDYGFRDMSVTWGLSSGNLAGGIRTMTVVTTGPAYRVQVQFTAEAGEPTAGDPLAKDATKELVVNWQTRWVRR